MKRFDEYELEEILKNIEPQFNDYCDNLNPEELEEYLQMYANELIDSAKKYTSSEVMEEAKTCLLEYYDIQDLWDKGYLRDSGDLSEYHLDLLENDEGNEIEIDNFEWDECELHTYIIDNDYKNASRNFSWISSMGIYIERGEIEARSVNELVEKTVNERHAEYMKPKIFRDKLEAELELGEEVEKSKI